MFTRAAPLAAVAAPEKFVGALHVSKSFDMFADDRFMVARHDCGGHPPRLAHGRGELVKPVAFTKS